MKRIELIGCGNIAGLITEFSFGGDVIAVFDRHVDRSDRIAKKSSAKAFTEFDRFLNEPFDLVIEIASIGAVTAYAEAVLHKQCDLLILSAGALADDEELLQRLLNIAKERSRRILIPSGALFGLDNAKIARYGEVALGIAAQKEVQIELWVDPSIVMNTHEVHLCGSFGEAVLTIDNKPSPHNPSTSYLAALSVVTMINTLDSTIIVGT